MRNHHLSIKPALATVLVLFFCFASINAQQAAKKRLPPAKSLAGDQGWPRFYNTPSGGIISVHQPQVISWADQKHVVAFSAVSYLQKDKQKPDLGTIKIEAETLVSAEKRLVNFSNLKISEANFPTLAKDTLSEVATEITNSIPKEDRIIALERVLSYVEASAVTAKNVEGLKNDPPVIHFSQAPAILLAFDGEPIWSPIKETVLKYAVNTNWDVFQVGTEYYLRIDQSWLKTTDLKGTWKVTQVPASFAKLPADENWGEARLNFPGKPLKTVPQIFAEYQPAELLALDGPPKYVPVAGTGLQWVSNTESDVFRVGADGAVYYLVAGRWFTASGFEGPWTFASLTLPEDFKKIPADHPRARVLSSVPGTQQAIEAVVLAQIPQTARVNIKEVKAPDVVYQGEPHFVTIEGTSLSRATNTDKDVIKFGDAYYMCFQGIWFVGQAPTGPWKVATTVPPEIYQIPANSPAHNVTYVTMQQDQDEPDWVEASAYAGYTGLMVGWGCPIWGTGWYYPPYYYGGIYYPYWRTYGYGSWYNPYNGIYGTAGRIYGPYGGAGFGARYNPATGTYARGAFAYGPNGIRGGAQAYNPRTGNYAQTRQGSNGYGSWGSTAVKRGDDWASTKRFSNNVTGNTTRLTRTEQGGAITRKGENGRGFVGKQGDNIYAGSDGNVYRRDGSGNWQKYENGSWTDPNRTRDSFLSPEARDRERGQRDQAANRDRAANRDGVGNRDRQPGAGNLDMSGLRGNGNRLDPGTMQRLNQDSRNRERAQQQMRQRDSFQRSGGYNRGSYGGMSRGGGGMSRGGGGMRGGGGRRR